MSKKKSISLAIIVWNELKSSEVIFPQINQKGFEQIYVIDGGSTDGTKEFYAKYGIPVYKQSVKGLGGATFEARKRCETEAIVFFHPDGNENPADLPKFRTCFNKGAELVIPSRMILGSRNEEDDEFLKPRKWVNQVLVLIANILWGDSSHKATDPTQGYRGITVKAYDKLQLDMANLTIDYQMIIRALKKKISIMEFPTIEGERLFGETTFKSIPTGIAELKMLWREIMMGNNC